MQCSQVLGGEKMPERASELALHYLHDKSYRSSWQHSFCKTIHIKSQKDKRNDTL